MQIKIRTVWVVVCLWVVATANLATAAQVQSTFDSGDEGWTQVNLGGDYRELDDIAFEGDCLMHVAGGVLTACDPDPGTWMFQAPPKFLGNQTAALDGYVEYRIYWQGEGVLDPLNPVPNVIFLSSIAGTNFGIARVLGDPPMNQWTTNRISFNEDAGWLWMSEETGMEDLPLATRAQIAQVLAAVTAFRITGEFITGDDTGFLDNVILAGTGTEPDRPRLNIRLISTGQVELSWPATALNYLLETNGMSLASEHWQPVSTSGGSAVTLPVGASHMFFRLRQQ
jgi:hypothetical protein